MFLVSVNHLDITCSYGVIAARLCTANMDVIVECTLRGAGVGGYLGDFSSQR